MKNKIITLIVASIAVLAAFDAQAFKKAATARPAVTSSIVTQEKQVAVKPATTPTPVGKKVGVSEAERNAIKAEIIKVQTRAIHAAASLGTKEDATEFMDKLFIEIQPQMKALKAKIESLPTKQALDEQSQQVAWEKRRQEHALTDKDKDALRALAKTWKRADLFKNYQEYLTKNNRDWDDSFTAELSGLAKD